MNSLLTNQGPNAFQYGKSFNKVRESHELSRSRIIISPQSAQRLVDKKNQSSSTWEWIELIKQLFINCTSSMTSIFYFWSFIQNCLPDFWMKWGANFKKVAIFWVMALIFGVCKPYDKRVHFIRPPTKIKH